MQKHSQGAEHSDVHSIESILQPHPHLFSHNLYFLLASRETDGPYLRYRVKDEVFKGKKRLLVGESIENTINNSSTFVQRLKRSIKLKKHTGCVNTIQWNEDGTKLITGSDDCKLNIWESAPHYRLLNSLEPGHFRNIFCGKFVPNSGDTKVVSCGMDGQVRLTEVESGEARLLFSASHFMAYKIFFLPFDSSTFLTTHQDGYIRLFDVRDHAKCVQAVKLKGKDKRSAISANSLAFSPVQPSTFVVGGADPFLRCFDIRILSSPRISNATSTKVLKYYCPSSIQEIYKNQPYANLSISGLDFNHQNQIVANYTKQDLYLFDGMSENRGEGEVISDYLQVYRGRRNVQTFLKEVSFFLHGTYVVTGGDCGNMMFWETKTGRLLQLLKADRSVVNGIAPHPLHLPDLATCGIDSEGKVWECGDAISFDLKKARDILLDNRDQSSEEEELPEISLVSLLRLLARRPSRWLSREDDEQDQEAQDQEEQEESNEQEPAEGEEHQRILTSSSGSDSHQTESKDLAEPVQEAQDLDHLELELAANRERKREGRDQEKLRIPFQHSNARGTEQQGNVIEKELELVSGSLSPEEEHRLLIEERIQRAEDIRSKANQKYHAGDYQVALSLYDTALSQLDFAEDSVDNKAKKQAGKLPCLLNKAACYVKLRDYAHVIENCNLVLEIQPDNLKALYRRGLAHFETNENQLAHADLTRAAQISPHKIK